MKTMLGMIVALVISFGAATAMAADTQAPVESTATKKQAAVTTTSTESAVEAEKAATEKCMKQNLTGEALENCTEQELKKSEEPSK